MQKRNALAAQLKSVCTARGVFLLIGADAALAKKIGADGVHFPSWVGQPCDVPDGMLSTVSCHTATDLDRAMKANADLVFLSPAFPTPSHPRAKALGPALFRKLAASSPLPVLALGGVNERNGKKLAGANVAGLAAIGAFLE